MLKYILVEKYKWNLKKVNTSIYRIKFLIDYLLVLVREINHKKKHQKVSLRDLFAYSLHFPIDQKKHPFGEGKK